MLVQKDHANGMVSEGNKRGTLYKSVVKKETVGRIQRKLQLFEHMQNE